MFGSEVAWLEAPPMPVPDVELLDYLGRPLTGLIPNPFHAPEKCDLDFWPTLEADRARLDEALRVKGYELVDEP